MNHTLSEIHMTHAKKGLASLASLGPAKGYYGPQRASIEAQLLVIKSETIATQWVPGSRSLLPGNARGTKLLRNGELSRSTVRLGLQLFLLVLRFRNRFVCEKRARSARAGMGQVQRPHVVMIIVRLPNENVSQQESTNYYVNKRAKAVTQ